MTTEASHKEVTLKAKYKALKELEERRINKYFSSKFNFATSTLST